MPTISNRRTIILIPYPAQGHVTPMLKLASLLSTLNFRPVVITPEFIHRRLASRLSPDDDILCFSIPDGLDDETPRDFFAIERAMEEYMPKVLEEVVLKMMNEDGGVVGLVVDLLSSWAVEVARRCGVPVAGFWPAMYATYRLIAAIPELIRSGIISENGLPRNLTSPICFSPGDPILTAKDLPWLIGSTTARIKRFKFWSRTLQRSKTLRWILTNTFQEEFKLQPTIFTGQKSREVVEIGPLIMKVATMSTSSFWEEDMSCLSWLDEQNARSVMYVSFGSWVSPIGDENVRELALTLEALGRPFIWVLGPMWRRGLPDKYARKVNTHGRIVSWAPQVEVLQHPAIGCYLSHCGWNSIVEAIQCKKPLVCYPIAGDQFLNCVYIVDVWKIGVKIERFAIGEVEGGIRDAMDEEVTRRIERLNEKLFGKESSSRAMTNLSSLIQNFIE